MIWERKLSEWIERIRYMSPLPLRLQLWNGQQFDCSQHIPEVTLHIPSVSTLNYLFKSSLSQLGAAYVEGQCDIEGPITRVIEIAHALTNHHTTKTESWFARLCNLIQHSKVRDAQAI